jgi:hypothetical protein
MFDQQDIPLYGYWSSSVGNAGAQSTTTTGLATAADAGRGMRDLSERQASTHRKGQFTNSHLKALAILSDHYVGYMAEQVVHCFGEFDGEGRPVSYKVDILINDPRYSSGVIEIDGDVHRKLNHERKDLRRDHHLIMQKLWVEHIANDQIGTIMQVLEKHKRRIDDYGGVY